MENQNYHKIMREHIEGLACRPSLLLHACCAPCASAVIPLLTPHFDVGVMFFNPNITDRGEYEHRLGELVKLIGIFNENRISPKPLKFVPSRYAPSEYYDSVMGLENEREGGSRCARCFYLRLQETRQAAAAKGYQYFCTTLTVSPHKNAALINRIGLELQEDCGVKYLPSDFKKENGYQKSIESSKKFGLYRQNYCGCEFSLPSGKH